jgi:hypothetical protein
MVVVVMGGGLHNMIDINCFFQALFLFLLK